MTETKPDTKFRACKMACGVTEWGVKPRVCDACRVALSLASGGGGSAHGGDLARAEREKRIEGYAAQASAKWPLFDTRDAR